jgi:2-oxo-4-hydroxy-4-carboxy--5-ureidoimidazoline (OHCU) decarboxylase
MQTRKSVTIYRFNREGALDLTEKVTFKNPFQMASRSDLLELIKKHPRVFGTSATCPMLTVHCGGMGQAVELDEVHRAMVG